MVIPIWIENCHPNLESQSNNHTLKKRLVSNFISKLDLWTWTTNCCRSYPERLSLPVREIWEPRMQMGSCKYIPHSFSQQIQDLQLCSWHVQSCCSLIMSVVLSVSKQTTKPQYNAQAEGSILPTTWSTIWNSTSFLPRMKLERSTLLCICSSYSICQYLKSSSNIML